MIFDSDNELCSKISDILTKSHFSLNGLDLNTQFVNKGRILYSEYQNKLYILETDQQEKKVKHYLWDFSYQITGILKDIQFTRSEVIFLNEEDQKIKVNGIIEFIGGVENQLLAVKSAEHLFVTKIENIMKKEIGFQKVGSLISTSILQAKWMKFAKEHIAILTQNSFEIYNIEENLDEPEYRMELDKDKKIVDFCFSRNDVFFDLSHFAIFFLSENGEIYYKCPIMIQGFKILDEDIEFLKDRIRKENTNKTNQKYNLDHVLRFLDELPNLCIKEENSGKMIINKTKPNLDKDVLQGPIKISPQRESNSLQSNVFRSIFKLENTLSHIFVVTDIYGDIQILFSTLNIWQSKDLNVVSDYKHPSRSNREEEFSLILMDAFKLECDLPLKKEFIDVQYRQFREKNNGEAAVIQMSDQKWIIHVLFFNKLFQINLNWIGEFENSFFTTDISTGYQKTLEQSNISIVLENSKPIKKVQELKNINYLDYGFFGFTMIGKVICLMKSNGKSTALNCVTLEKKEIIIIDEKEIAEEKPSIIKKDEAIPIIQRKASPEFDPKIGRTDKNLIFSGDKETDIKIVEEYMKNFERREVQEITSKIKNVFKNVKLVFGNVVNVQNDCLQIINNLEEKKKDFKLKEENFKQKKLEIEKKMNKIMESLSKFTISKQPSLYENKIFEMMAQLDDIKLIKNQLENTFQDHINRKRSLPINTLDSESTKNVIEIITGIRASKDKAKELEELIVSLDKSA